MNGAPDLSVVDTNVPVVANGADVSLACQLACVEVLQAIVDSKRIALEDGNLIFDEYRANLSLSGQPGVGDQFMKWVNDNMWNADRCELVHLDAENGTFAQFPDDPRLEGFDPSDRKFAAVAALTGAPVLNAIDPDWRNYEAPLADAGIVVLPLCANDLDMA